MIETENETPEWPKAIQQLIEARVCEIHTSMPGRIVSYDSATQKASVQPELKRKYRDGSTLSPPVIPDVTVMMPRAGKAFLSLPLKSGDQVTIFFMERSTDDWKQTGGEVDPSAIPRKHSFADAFCYPGGYPFNRPADMDPNDVLLVNDSSIVQLKTGGKFEMKKKGGDAVLDLIFQYMEINSSAVTNTMLGPQKKVEETQLKQIQQKLKKLIAGG